MVESATDMLWAQVSAQKVKTGPDFLNFLAIAARLAALGHPDPLTQWPALARQVNAALEPQIASRIAQSELILQQQKGELLAGAIIDAQDFHCFYNLQRDILPPLVAARLTAWRDAAELAPLDAHAAELLQLFLTDFPIPPALRLAIIDAPVEQRVIAAVGLLAAPPLITDAFWPAVESSQARDVPEAAVAYMADGRPSERFQRIMERLDVPMEVRGLGPVLLTRRIGDDWALRIGLRQEDGAAAAVAGVRLGAWKAAVEADGSEWVVPLRHFPHMQRVALLAQPVVIAFNNGAQLQVR